MRRRIVGIAGLRLDTTAERSMNTGGRTGDGEVKKVLVKFRAGTGTSNHGPEPAAPVLRGRTGYPKPAYNGASMSKVTNFMLSSIAPSGTRNVTQPLTLAPGSRSPDSITSGPLK